MVRNGPYTPFRCQISVSAAVRVRPLLPFTLRQMTHPIPHTLQSLSTSHSSGAAGVSVVCYDLLPAKVGGTPIWVPPENGTGYLAPTLIT